MHAPPPGSPKLLTLVRSACRLRHFSLRTEKAYLYWIRRYILFHGKQHPASLGARHLSVFLSHLALEERVAASTQNQALNALVFLYRSVLDQEIDLLDGFVRARRPRRLPLVLSRSEVETLFVPLQGLPRLLAGLLYGSGLRLMEALRLRVKDLEFDYRQLVVREGKGQKDRRTMLPEVLHEPLRRQLLRAKTLHEEDLEAGYGEVYLPYALERKYPTQGMNGPGSTSFRPPGARSTRRAGRSGGTICRAPSCRRR